MRRPTRPRAGAMAGATAEPMTRRGVFAFVLAGFLGALAASAQAHSIELRGKLVADGKLTFGVALSGRPFAYRLDGALRGFEIDWAREVADSRGLELEAVLFTADLGVKTAQDLLDEVRREASGEPPEKVRDDLLDGLISPEAARDVYGLELDAAAE